MKTFIITLFFTALSVISFAQDSEHLTFKGVPIDGTLSEYISKMKGAGFSYLGESDGLALLYGDFAGYKGCTIGITTLKSLDVVNKITVIFPECTDWSTLENNYEFLKSMLTQKYGSPNDVVEKFQGRVTPTANNEKLHELYMDRCTWYTTYETPKGNIKLHLSKTTYGEYVVVLVYFDKLNTESVTSKVIDEL